MVDDLGQVAAVAFLQDDPDGDADEVEGVAEIVGEVCLVAVGAVFAFVDEEDEVRRRGLGHGTVVDLERLEPDDRGRGARGRVLDHAVQHGGGDVRGELGADLRDEVVQDIEVFAGEGGDEDERRVAHFRQGVAELADELVAGGLFGADVPLVDDEDAALAGLLDHARDGLVLRGGGALVRLDHEEDDVAGLQRVLGTHHAVLLDRAVDLGFLA